MRISARADYAIRALVELAADDGDAPVKADRIATAQAIPIKFLENILTELRRAGLVDSRRGAEGGHRLARPAAAISVADIVRAIDGPLANVRGDRPEAISYPGHAAPLRDVWVALRQSIRDVLEQVTLADVASGALPPAVRDRTADPAAWQPH